MIILWGPLVDQSVFSAPDSVQHLDSAGKYSNGMNMLFNVQRDQDENKEIIETLQKWRFSQEVLFLTDTPRRSQPPSQSKKLLRTKM